MHMLIDSAAQIGWDALRVLAEDRVSAGKAKGESDFYGTDYASFISRLGQRNSRANHQEK